MIFKIGDNYYHPEDVPCAIIFISDEERINAGKLINDIVEYSSKLILSPEQKQTSCFAAHNSNIFTPEEFEKWSYPPEEELAKSKQQINVGIQL